MKNKIFSGKLYIETLRRLRIPAIVLIGICWAITMVTNAVELMELNRFSNMGKMLRDAAALYNGMSSILWMFVFVAPVVLVFGTFHFMNSRSSSDFYHSMPYTRVASFLSMFAAVSTILTGGVISTMLIDLAGKLIISGTAQIGIDFAGYLFATADFLIICLMMSGGLALAMSLTGTFISNMVVAFLILYCPRIILAILSAIGQDAAPVLVMDHMGLLFDFKYNLLLSPISVLSAILGNADPMRQPPYMIYSLILGIAYVGLALLAYVRRNSETADRSASSSLMRRIYSLILITPMALGAAFAAMNRSRFEPSLIIILVVLDLLLFLVYETVTTKGIKSFVRGLPAFLAVIVCAFLVTMGVRGLFISRMNSIPEADEVASVSLAPGDRLPEDEYIKSDYTSYYGSISYAEAKLSEIEHKDKNVIDGAVKALENDVARIRKNDVSYGRHTICYTMKNGRKIYRQVSEQDMNAVSFTRRVTETTEAKTLMSVVPDNKEIEAVLIPQLKGVVFAPDSDFWKEFRTELESMGENGLKQAGGLNEKALCSVVVCGSVNGIRFSSVYNISAEDAKLADICVRFINSSNREAVKNELKYKYEDESMSIFVEWFTKEGGVYRRYVDANFNYTKEYSVFSDSKYDYETVKKPERVMLDGLLPLLDGRLDEDPSFASGDLIMRIGIARNNDIPYDYESYEYYATQNYSNWFDRSYIYERRDGINGAPDGYWYSNIKTFYVKADAGLKELFESGLGEEYMILEK